MMLAAGHAPGEIAAITFTELAASQLAGRIRETIDLLLAGEVPTFIKAVLPRGLSDQQRTALTEASSRLNELTATTIHGFCQAIIRSGPKLIDGHRAHNILIPLRNGTRYAAERQRERSQPTS
jgi:CRISPR-associated exonuclease Cas4